MAGHGAGEVPSRNTVGTHQNEGPRSAADCIPWPAPLLRLSQRTSSVWSELNWSRNRMHVVTPLFNNVHSSSSFLITSQHLHQRVWAVPNSQSGQGDEMTPCQERKGLRTCTHTPHQMCTVRNWWCISRPWAQHWPNCDHKDRQGLNSPPEQDSATPILSPECLHRLGLVVDQVTILRQH